MEPESDLWTKYTLDNNDITPDNLHLFYSSLKCIDAIPYKGVVITDTDITWSWEYSGGWGLGYDGSLKYNKADKRYYLECYRNSTLFDGTLDDIRMYYTIEWINEDQICVSTTDIYRVIDAGYYYSFDFAETFSGTNVKSTEKSIKRANELCKVR